MCYNQLIRVFCIEVCGSRKHNQGKEVFVMSKETLEYVVTKAKELIGKDRAVVQRQKKRPVRGLRKEGNGQAGRRDKEIHR